MYYSELCKAKFRNSPCWLIALPFSLVLSVSGLPCVCVGFLQLHHFSPQIPRHAFHITWIALWCLWCLLHCILSLHHCIENTWPLVQITNNQIKSQAILIDSLPQPTSSSLSLSDPALHSDWLDDSLLAELWKTEHTH